MIKEGRGAGYAELYGKMLQGGRMEAEEILLKMCFIKNQLL